MTSNPRRQWRATQITTPLEERVARGVEILSHCERSWAWGLDLDALDMMDSRLCVLGQTYGSYGEGLEAIGAGWQLRVDPMWATRNGFFVASSDEMEALTEAWRAEAKRRLP